MRAKEKLVSKMPTTNLTTKCTSPMGMLSAGACNEYGLQVDCPYFGDMQRAVVEGSVETLKSLLDRGASLTSTPSGGSTLAHHAATEGNIPILDFLAKQVGPACLIQPDSEGATPLHFLCTTGGSLLHLATSTLAYIEDRPKSFAHGAPSVRANIGIGTETRDDYRDKEDEDDEGKEKSIVVSQLTEKRVDAIAWMLNHKALARHVLEMGEIQEGGFRCPSHLAKQFEDLLGSSEQEQGEEGVPMDDVSRARRRLVDIRDGHQETPLIWACSFEIDDGASQDGARTLERLPIVKLLVSLGADPNAQNVRGCTAMHAAARAGAYALVEFLFYEAHASPAIRDASGNTPLACAKTFSRDKATIDLLRRCTPLNNDIKKAVEQGL